MDREKRIRRLISMKKYFLEAGLGMIAVFVIDIAIDYIASGLRGETFSPHFMTLILLMGVVFIGSALCLQNYAEQGFGSAEIG